MVHLFLIVLALVLCLSSAQLTELTSFQAQNGASSDYFGYSVSISGALVVVGAYGDSTGNVYSHGSAFVFSCTSLSCTQIANLTAPTLVEEDRFGYSVAIEGSLVVVGANQRDVDEINNCGAAYVYTCTSSSGCTYHQELTANEKKGIANFGRSVAISGNKVVVGAHQDSSPGPGYHGTVYVFECFLPPLSVSCTQTKRLLASNGVSGDYFGISVAISGDLVVVGAPLTYTSSMFNNHGSAYVFALSQCLSPDCTEQVKLGAFDKMKNDNFGYSVAISGSLIVVGANYATRNGKSSQGLADVFECNEGISSCLQLARLEGNDSQADDNFGWSVAVQGRTVLVGADGDGTGSVSYHGSVYRFDCTSSNCTQTGKYPTGNFVDSGKIGASVSISKEGRAVTGARGIDYTRGKAFLLDLGFCPSTTEANSNWPATARDQAANGTCEEGYSGSPSRLCDANGNWQSIQGSCTLVTSGPRCPIQPTYGKATWPSTPANNYARGECIEGYTGTPLRFCNSDGSWATLITDHCVQRKCASTTEDNASFPGVFQSQISFGTCQAGFVGKPRRKCNSDGNFDEILSPCIADTVTCPAETFGNADWANDVIVNTYGVGSCVEGYEGNPLRKCQTNGQWRTLIEGTKCTRKQCPMETTDNADWPATPREKNVIGKCVAGYVGAPTRLCNSVSKWGPISNPCRPQGNCPIEYFHRNTYWPETAPGELARGTCDSANGYSGAPFRNCLKDGTWETLVQYPCKKQ